LAWTVKRSKNLLMRKKKKWREKHRQRLKESKLAEQKERENVQDEDLMRHLDQLELEEELDEYEKCKETSTEADQDENDEEDWSESPPLTEDEDEPVKDLSLSGPRRSVSFGDVSERLFSREQDNDVMREETHATDDNETKIIEFKPSVSLSSTISSTMSEMPTHPGDLYKMFGLRFSKGSQSRKAPKKSILKAGSKYVTSPPSTEPPLPLPTLPIKEPLKPSLQQAVSDVVIERQKPDQSDENTAGAIRKPVTQMFSRFRATRVNQI